jgi:hypothetical protein
VASSGVCPGSTTATHALDVRYDVNGSAKFYLAACNPFPIADVTVPAALRTITLNVTNAFDGVVRNEVLNKPSLSSGASLITQQTITLDSYDVQPDGKVSLIVIGKNAAGIPVAYGALLDQTFTDGMTVNVTVDQPMSFIQYDFTNIPATANFLCSWIIQARTDKESAYSLGVCNGFSSVSAPTVSVPYIPGLGDRFDYGVNLEVTLPDAASRSSQILRYIGLSSISDQNFDFNTALSAPLNLTVTAADTERPTLSWTGVDPATEQFHVYAEMRLSSSSYFYLGLDNLSLTRTSITFPELPDSLAEFRPAAVTLFGVSTSNDDGFVSKSSYGWYWNPDSPHYKSKGTPSVNRNNADTLGLPVTFPKFGAIP